MTTTVETRGSGVLDAYSRVVTDVAATLLPSVASLKISAGDRWGTGGGSGVIISPDGYLVTSAHVVARASRGSATLTDGREMPFDVVGADRLSDLAVVRVAGSDLSPAQLGDADDLSVGQLVVAIGSPLGYAGSVSAGVVSALGRSLPTQSGDAIRVIENVIQTDASLHPGNSGGALADARARVVGINTAMVGPGVGQGLGLAVPVNTTTRAIIASLLREGLVVRGYLGVAGGSRPLAPRGARVAGRTDGIEVVSVVAGSPAAAGGIRPADVLLDVDGVAVAAVGDLQELMSAERVGRKIPVRVLRGTDILDLVVEPVELR